VPAERFHLAAAEVLVGADVEETARIAAGQFTAAARSIAGEGKPFHVALCGGNSPRPLFQLLATEPFRKLVPWESIRFFWGDERNVPPNDPESNYSTARELLLRHVCVPATHIHRIPTGDGTAIEAADLYQRTLHELLPPLNGKPRLDYLLLGLGSNGHIASLFPHRPTLHEEQRLVVADHVDEINAWRVTLTAHVLNNAAQITFLVTGEEKASIVERVLEGPRDPEAVPAQLIAPVSGSVTWILDAAAASLLSRPGSSRAAS
jgi:6-phosphogluconolactonase